MNAEQFNTLMAALTKTLQVNQNTTPITQESISIDPFSEENESWEMFIKRLDNFFSMKNFTGSADYIDTKKKEWLLHTMGTKTLQLIHSLTCPDDPKSKDYTTLVSLLQNHLDPSSSIIAEQNRFTKRVQQEGETIANYVTELKKMTTNCKFVCDACKASTSDAHLRLQFISGLRNSNLIERLIQLKEPDNKFKNCVDTALTMELAQKDSREIHSLQICASTSFQNQIKKFSFKPEQQQKNISPSNLLNFQRKCYRCGDPQHLANTCKHKNSKCTGCLKYGHVFKACRGTPRRENVHQVEEEPEEMENNFQHEELFFMNVLDNNCLPEAYKKPGKILLNLQLDGESIKFEYDTGAAVSSISQDLFNAKFSKKTLQKTNLPLRTYTGEIIRPIGYSTFQVELNNQIELLNLYILPGKVEPIFGREWMQKIKVDLPEICQLQNENIPDFLKLKIIEELKNNFPEVFKPGLGKISNYKAKLFLPNNTKPIYVPARKVPYALKEKVEREIDRLEEIGVLTKMEYSEWGTPVVPIMKSDGSVRLCADFKITLNKVLINDKFPIPNIEDIFATTMHGGKIFTTLDIREAYLHMPMDEESSRMQAITTEKGDYKVHRLMFGTKVAPAIWQRYISNLLDKIPGVCVFLDDIKIQGATLQENVNRVRTVLQCLQEAGLHIKQEKCKFFEESITYLGHKISSRGLEKTEDKIKAVKNAPVPTNVTELKSWLGLVTYYGRFLKDLSSKIHPLYKLLQKNVIFRWTSICDQAFNLIKKEITSDQILCAYNPKLPLILATDASPKGLGAVLSHIFPDGERPIVFASRSLTRAEKNYSQIDKEATAIFWACNKFFQYCYGRKFTLITDHQPLVSIFNPNKNLPSMVATRMLHYAQFLQGFNYDIIYRSSEKHLNADALSRLPQKITPVFNQTMDGVTIHQLQQILTLPVTHREIANETQEDPILRNVYKSLQTGKKIEESEFKGKDIEFSLNEGTIVKDSRIVVPKTLRQRVLKELHEAHTGIVRMKSLARSFVWWPRIDLDIEELAKKCQSCQSMLHNKTNIPPHCWETPKGPWQRVHIDFAGPFQGTYFLVICDAYSKWPEIFITKSMNTLKTISILRGVFARFGLPVTLVSDNGGSFTSQEFKNFLKTNGIIHKFTAPYHPASNGQVERYVGTMKNTLKKMVDDPGDLDLKLQNFLMQYRKIPHTSNNQSPSQLMYGRDIRTKLDLVRFQKPIEVANQASSKFMVGESVRVRHFDSRKNCLWKFGRILKRESNLIYLIEMEDRIIRRHINHIASTKVECPVSQPNVCYVPEAKQTLDTENTTRDNVVGASSTQHFSYIDPEQSKSTIIISDSTPEVSTSAEMILDDQEPRDQETFPVESTDQNIETFYQSKTKPNQIPENAETLRRSIRTRKQPEKLNL